MVHGPNPTHCLCLCGPQTSLEQAGTVSREAGQGITFHPYSPLCFQKWLLLGVHTGCQLHIGASAVGNCWAASSPGPSSQLPMLRVFGSSGGERSVLGPGGSLRQSETDQGSVLPTTQPPTTPLLHSASGPNPRAGHSSSAGLQQMALRTKLPTTQDQPRRQMGQGVGGLLSLIIRQPTKSPQFCLLACNVRNIDYLALYKKCLRTLVFS